MQVIGSQLDILWEQPQGNYQKIIQKLSQQTIQPGSLLIFPEMFSTGYSMNVDTIAEPATHSTTDFLTKIAAQHQVAALGGLVTKNEKGRGQNELVAVSPEGETLVRYQKIKTFSYADEPDYYDRGDEVKVFSWQGWKICPLICYDLRFPEIFRTGLDMGAEIFVVIASWPAARKAHWTALLKARAIENQAYVVGVNRVGKDPNVTYSGDSVVIDPLGEVLTHAGDKETLMIADLSRETLEGWRDKFSAILDR